MVAHITEGTAFDKHGRPFRRRNFIPGIALFAALAVATMVVWVFALNQPTHEPEVVACNPPPAPTEPGAAPPSLGERVAASEMIEITPARLADTRIRVLNATGRGGHAAEIAGALGDLGFVQPEALNDPVYSSVRLECQGQIRFGPEGRAAAAAVWLVAPCTELYQDARPDATVDLALGTDFEELSSSDDIQAVLASLGPDATAPADPALLERIHTGTC
ncbi:envelope integrity protein Cei [Mycolicibacterium thermoresistibile]